MVVVSCASIIVLQGNSSSAVVVQHDSLMTRDTRVLRPVKDQDLVIRIGMILQLYLMISWICNGVYLLFYLFVFLFNKCTKN